MFGLFYAIFLSLSVVYLVALRLSVNVLSNQCPTCVDSRMAEGLITFGLFTTQYIQTDGYLFVVRGCYICVCCSVGSIIAGQACDNMPELWFVGRYNSVSFWVYLS